MLGDDDDHDGGGGGPVVFLHPHSDALNDLENGWEAKEYINDWGETPQVYFSNVYAT